MIEPHDLNIRQAWFVDIRCIPLLRLQRLFQEKVIRQSVGIAFRASASKKGLHGFEERDQPINPQQQQQQSRHNSEVFLGQQYMYVAWCLTLDLLPRPCCRGYHLGSVAFGSGAWWRGWWDGIWHHHNTQYLSHTIITIIITIYSHSRNHCSYS